MQNKLNNLEKEINGTDLEDKLNKYEEEVQALEDIIIDLKENFIIEQNPENVAKK